MFEEIAQGAERVRVSVNKERFGVDDASSDGARRIGEHLEAEDRICRYDVLQ